MPCVLAGTISVLNAEDDNALVLAGFLFTLLSYYFLLFNVHRPLIEAVKLIIFTIRIKLAPRPSHLTSNEAM